MDRLDAMQLFVRVVDSGSYTAAAEQMEISRALASKLIQALEERLGVRLLHRTTRRLSLTEAGEAYYQRASNILVQLAEAESEAAELQVEPRGRLRVSAPMSFAVRHLGNLLGEFQHRFPRIELELSLNDRQVDLVEEGFDLAIRIARLADSSYVARQLAPAKLAVVASPAYLKRHGEPTIPTELARHNCLIYTLTPRPGEWVFLHGEERTAVNVKGNLRVNNGDVLVRAAIDSAGIALSPTFMIGDELRAGTLVPLLTRWKVPAPGIYAIYPPSRALPAKTRSLIDFLAERFGPRPYWDINI